MFFLNFPAPLWFLRGGGATEQKSASLNANVSVVVAETSIAFSASTVFIPFSLSAAYRISTSLEDVTSIQLELSSFQYPISVSAGSISLLAFLSADNAGGGYDHLNAYVTATPVFVLSQSGQSNKSVEASYTISAAGTTASIAGYLSVTGSYPVSVSVAQVSASASQIFSVSAAYQISASADVALLKTQALVELSVAQAYAISCSTSARVVIDRGGGLIWGRKKKRYFPKKVGYPL